jgi:chemotaxis protein methyltransferase CheR
MTPEAFEFLRKFLRERSGLVLAAEKQYLAESRLLPVARRHGMESPAELVEKLESHRGALLGTDVVEAMATNETFFFRDKTPFEHLRNTIFPKLVQTRANERQIRIWCTAASTGQEPYSIAMIVKELEAALGNFRVDIVATDLSGFVLDRAKQGVYTQFEVQRGLPIQLLLRHFSKVDENWQINPDIRAMVQFRPLNLLNDFSALGAFDLIFCRNVLIYFDCQTKANVLNKIARQMSNDSYLILGAAETVVGITDEFKSVPDKQGLYVRNTSRLSDARSNMLRFAV